MKSIPIIILLLGVIIGLSLCNLFQREKVGTSASPQKVKTTVLQKIAVEEEKQFTQKANAFTYQNTTLDLSLKKTQTQLRKAHEKNIRLSVQLKGLLTSQSLYKKDNDTLLYLTGCDSLQEKVIEVMNASVQHDSIQEEIKFNLAEQLQNRDSVIMLSAQFSASCKTSLDRSLVQQQAMEIKLNSLARQYKRKRIAGKLQSVGMIILALFAAKQFTD